MFRCGWEDNIKMNLRENERKGVSWMHVVQGKDHWPAIVNTIMKFWGSIKGEKFLDSLSEF